MKLTVRQQNTYDRRTLIRSLLLRLSFTRFALCLLPLMMASRWLPAEEAPVALPPSLLQDPLIEIAGLRKTPLPLSYNFEIDSYTTSSVPTLSSGPVPFPEKPSFRVEGQARIKGNLIDIRKRESSWVDGKWVQGNNTRQLFDGKRFWTIQHPPTPGLWCPLLLFNQDTTQTEIAKAIADAAGLLDGHFPFFPSGDWLFTALMMPNTKVEVKEESVGEFQCRKIMFRGGKNVYTFWVDMKHGGLPRQILCIFPEKPLSTFKKMLTIRKPGEIELRIFEVRDIKIEKIADREVPMAGTFVERTFYRDGKRDCRVDRIHRSKVAINPSDLGKFECGLVDGIVVDASNIPVKYEWRSGTMLPFLDPTVLTGIDDAVKQITREATAAPAPLLKGMRLLSVNSESTPTLVGGRNPALDPHCYDAVGPRDGLYCLYAVLRLAGVNVTPETLLRPEYFDPKTASITLAQLDVAAHKFGLHAATVTALTARALAASPYPILLRVKKTLYSKEYDAWELFLGSRNGQAWIWNIASPPRMEPFAKLIARSNGSGLILSNAPIKYLGLRTGDILWAVLASLVLALMMWQVRRLVRGRGTAKKIPGFIFFTRYSILEGLCFSAIALLAALLWHGVFGGGLLTANGAMRMIQTSRTGLFIPSVDISQIRRIVEGREKATLIDARTPFAFYLNHIPTAKNIPLGANDNDFRATLSGLPRDGRMVIYCASETCHMAESLAARMTAEGFTRLEIYKGGFAEWMESK